MGTCATKGTTAKNPSRTAKATTTPISQQSNTSNRYSPPLSSNGALSSYVTDDQGGELSDPTRVTAPTNTARPRRASIQPRTETIIEEQ